MNEENLIIIAGYGGGKATARIPKEKPEGILTGAGTGIVLSKTQIRVLDLICEGEIQGLATGKYYPTGTLGNVGWDSVTFSPYVSPTGTSGTSWLQAIFWDEVPVADQNGLFNFQQVSVNYAKGGPNGTDISDSILDELTVSRPIQERLRGGGEIFFKSYRILDKNCIGAKVNIRVNQLSKTSEDQDTLGDLLTTDISYSIYYRPIFATQPTPRFTLAKLENINGKVSNGYIRSTKIDFKSDYSNSDDFVAWEIKIVRWTEDSVTTAVRNQSFVDSLTEVYGSKFIYPNSAIVSSLFDAEYFTGPPTRYYETDMLKVKVPSNYDPIYKTYDETTPWNGTFKVDISGRILKQWTDNPVWCYYDLLTSNRYGLGSYVDESFLDKFTLYEISKYCDTLVSDGYGGLEPRFVCNVYINSRDDAYKVVNSMASIFRGITYYSAGQIYNTYDASKPCLYQFTNSNVVDGDFQYSSSARKARHTVAIVRYNDKRNYYKPTIEYVENIDAIRKYGIREVEVPAYGAVTRGQAVRQGRWALLTESLETESISFRAGIETIGFLRPGDVFQIYDSNRSTKRLGGRTTSVVSSPTSTSLVLDSQITGLDPNTTYKLSLLTPTYYYDTSLVSGLDSSDIPNIRRSPLQSFTFNSSNLVNINGIANINVNTGIDCTGYNVSGNNVWLIEATGSGVFGNIKNDEWETYRIINIREADANTYEIHGLEYDISKFLQIESGFSFTDIPVPTSLPFLAPTGLQLYSSPVSAHSQVINYSFGISDTTNIQSYRVLTKTSPFLTNDQYSGGYVIANLPYNVFSGYYLPAQDGTYYFRVYSVGKNSTLSNGYAENSINIIGVNPIQDVTISSLQLSAENIAYNTPGTISSGIYSSDSPTYEWQMGIAGASNIPSNIRNRITIRYPSINNIPSSEVYFSVTGYQSPDSTYKFNFVDNYTSFSNVTAGKVGPFRNYDIVVEAMTFDGYSSAGGNFVKDGDAKYNNANGYDIFFANNPGPQSINLYTGDPTSSFYKTGKATQQWITQDGEIKIFFTNSGNMIPVSGFFNDDIAGGTLFYSDSPFTIEEAQQKVPVSPSSKIINTFGISSNSNPMIAPVGLTNSNIQYISIAAYDSFDIGISNQINNWLITGVQCSNVVKIKKFGSSQLYQAWIEFDVGKQPDSSWGLIDNWRSRSFNIDNLTTSLFTDAFGDVVNAGQIIFTNPMPNVSYAVNVSYYQYSPLGVFVGGSRGGFDLRSPCLDTVPIISKLTDRIIIPSFDRLFCNINTFGGNRGVNARDVITGRCFIGVLQTI
jgi:hypothetical protein